MTKLVVTGADGFLGWHLRVLARALGWADAVPITRDDLQDPARAAALLDGADRVVHLAGANRGDDADVITGNVDPARALAAGLARCATPPRALVFANSTQAGNGTPYGESKARAASLLREAAGRTGSAFEDTMLPNVFGEHGRPFYNSVVATFCHVLATGGTAEIHQDRELDLLHATDAAARLLGVPEPAGGTRYTVTQLAGTLSTFAGFLRRGEIPDLATHHAVCLFNTYRSYCFPTHYPIRLRHHSDARGSLAEVVRVHGGGGQTFVSSTGAQVTRGDHFHLAKVERFAVLRGEGEIALRRLLHDDVVRFRVSGTDPVVVDMPSMWAHRITNVGGTELLTLFWSNDLFDPDRPDTYPEPVL